MDMKPNNLRILIEAALLDIFKDEPKVNDVKVGDVWYSPNALTFKIRISTSHIQEPTRKGANPRIKREVEVVFDNRPKPLTNRKYS